MQNNVLDRLIRHGGEFDVVANHARQHQHHQQAPATIQGCRESGSSGMTPALVKIDENAFLPRSVWSSMK
jgi:hypothetical protein